MTAAASPPPTDTLPTAARLRRVPPIRQRNLGRIAIGTLVLVVSTLGVVALTERTGSTRRVLVVRRSVAAGEALQPRDLGTIVVEADLPVATLPASARDQVVGRRAGVTLSRGTLLAAAQVSPSRGTSGTALVGATLSAGQYPSTLEVGDRVLVVTTPGIDAGTDAGAIPPTRGVVVEVRPAASSTAPTVVSLRVSIDDAPQVAAAGAGHISLVSVGP